MFGPTTESTLMTDLIYIGITVAFFLVSGLYAHYCETL